MAALALRYGAEALQRHKSRTHQYFSCEQPLLQVELRLRAGIKANSKLEILCAEHDVYVARIDDKVTIKMGPRYDIGDLAPKESDGWKKSVRGADWCTWEKA
jgi:hypothetical protein